MQISIKSNLGKHMRMKGRLVREKPYTVSPNGKYGKKIMIGHLVNWEIGDKVYQEVTDNGIVILIPEKIWLEENER